MALILPKIPGIKLNLGGEELIVPPLNLKALRVLQGKLENYAGGTDSESIETVIEAMHAALSRNYPEMTRDQVEEIIGLENMEEAMQAVMDVSGLLRKQKEAEATAGAPRGEPSTGASSTPT